MKAYKWIKMILFSSLITFVISACSSAPDSVAPIDPPPEDLYANAGIMEEAEVVATAEETMNASLYVLDSEGYVVPIHLDIPKSEGPAKKNLEYMVQGGPIESLLPEGFTAILPVGTRIIGMNIIPEKNLAIVDFSEEFTQYPADMEREIMESITWTLTQFPAIDQLELWVEGSALKEMPVDGTPLDNSLSRKMGINLEHSEGVNLSRSTPVTLFFQNHTADDQPYWVPVTRMIAQTEEVAKATVEQLIKGPAKASRLSEVIQPAAQLLQLSQNDGTITVRFADSFISNGDLIPSEALQSIILSVTENTNAAEVLIQVDGHSKVNSTDDQNYNIPVTRPDYLNSFEI